MLNRPKPQLIAAVLAVPIVGTSYLLVSQVGNDISMADGERATVFESGLVNDVFTSIERLHDCVGDNACPTVPTALADVERAVAAAQRRYHRRDLPRPLTACGSGLRLN